MIGEESRKSNSYRLICFRKDFSLERLINHFTNWKMHSACRDSQQNLKPSQNLCDAFKCVSQILSFCFRYLPPLPFFLLFTSSCQNSHKRKAALCCPKRPPALTQQCWKRHGRAYKKTAEYFQAVSVSE